MAEALTLTAGGAGGLPYQIELLSSHTLLDLARVLCAEVMKGMRGDDHGLNDHLWSFTVGTVAPPKGKVMWQDIPFVCEMWGDEDDEISLAETTALSSLGWSEASRFRFEYDMGDSAEVMLKVEKVGEMTAEAKSLPRVSERFPATSSSSANKQKWL